MLKLTFYENLMCIIVILSSLSCQKFDVLAIVLRLATMRKFGAARTLAYDLCDDVPTSLMYILDRNSSLYRSHISLKTSRFITLHYTYHNLAKTTIPRHRCVLLYKTYMCVCVYKTHTMIHRCLNLI